MVALASLSDADKERCRYHLGYLEVSLAASIQIGIPRPLQTVFLLESALSNLREANAVARVVCILDTMDSIEMQLAKAVQSVSADKLGELQLHPLRNMGILATDSLDKEYVRWGKRLADILGVAPYWFSERYRKMGPGSSIRVG